MQIVKKLRSGVIFRDRSEGYLRSCNRVGNGMKLKFECCSECSAILQVLRLETY